MNALLRQCEPEALILGGGPAGAAVAAQLARSGRAVELVEQSAAAHDKVCGEFLSREAVAYLDALGMDLKALGAVPIQGLRLAGRRAIAACELPFPALSLSRRTLDEALLAMAANAGAAIHRGQRVNALTPTASGWTAQLSGGETRSASTFFLATGKHDLASHRRTPGKQNQLVALKMYFRLTPAQQRALDGWVELFLFPGGYAGLQPVETERANLCLLIERKRFAACGHEWSAVLAHLLRNCEPLRERLEGAQPLLAKPLALGWIPYGLLLRTAAPHLWRLGDQAAVIPSFSGDGISIALHSANIAAGLYLRGGTSDEFAQRLAQDLRPSVGFATALSRLMIAAPVLAQAARLWPPLLQFFASRTRIPGSAWSADPLAAGV